MLLESFESNHEADAIIPHGMASYALIKGKYDYHDPYFMTSRCTAYRRSVLAELGGFMSHFVGQEDVEFVVRFFMARKKITNAPVLEYYHPPLLVPNFRKPKAVGFSFSGLEIKVPLCCVAAGNPQLCPSCAAVSASGQALPGDGAVRVRVSGRG